MITITVEERSLMIDMISKSKTCYVSMVTPDGLPYVVPMNFGFEDDVLYLHSAPEGGLVSIIEKNPNICVLFCSEPSLIHQHEEVACSYRMKGVSVICRGLVEFETDMQKKIEALDIIMKQYTNRKFTYSNPAVENVKIWKIAIDSVSTKVFGAKNPKSPKFREEDFTQYY